VECFPDLRRKFSDTRFGKYTIWQVFFDLLPRMQSAIAEGDLRTTAAIFAFTEWCAMQYSGEIESAVAVAFYEHVFDEREIWDGVVPFLSPTIIRQYWKLWETRPIFKTESIQSLWERLAPIANLPEAWAPRGVG
jgi:hypothetical protein